MSHIVAVKEASPIAGRYFAKRREYGVKRFRGGWRLLHLSQKVCIRLTHFCCRLLLIIALQMRSLMDPGISLLHIDPQGRCLDESFRQKSAHAFELTRQALFSETRVSEVAMAVIRS